MKKTYPVKLIDDLDPTSIIFDLPPAINLFAAFLVDAVKDEKAAEECLKTIQKVKDGVLLRGEFFGDIYKITITKATTQVEDIIDPDEYFAEIRTSELEDLIDQWVEEKNKVEE